MDDTKERILAAALDLFSLKGFAAVRTKEIAIHAEVNEVTIFRLFGSKRNLYIEVYRRFSVSPSEATILSSLSGDPEIDMKAIGQAITSLFLRNTKIVRMSFKDMESFPEIDSDLKRQPEILIALVSSYFRRVSAAALWIGAPERLARVFVSTLMGTVLHLNRFMDDDAVFAFIDEFVAILERGMRGTSLQR